MPQPLPTNRKASDLLVRLVLLLTVVPLVELTILLRLADAFHWGPTLALVVFTGVLGAWLARREGLKALARIQADLEAGVPPTGAVMDGVLILAAGIVLITPGILTDLCGFALLIPPLRERVKRWLAGTLRKRFIVVNPDVSNPFIDVRGESTEAQPPTHSGDPRIEESAERWP